MAPEHLLDAALGVDAAGEVGPLATGGSAAASLAAEEALQVVKGPKVNGDAGGPHRGDQAGPGIIQPRPGRGSVKVDEEANDAE